MIDAKCWSGFASNHIIATVVKYFHLRIRLVCVSWSPSLLSTGRSSVATIDLSSLHLLGLV
jgi:hypothetical protein